MGSTSGSGWASTRARSISPAATREGWRSTPPPGSLALAGPDEVIVSSTTRELLEGSGLSLEDAGEHELKGISGVRHVFRLVDTTG